MKKMKHGECATTGDKCQDRNTPVNDSIYVIIYIPEIN